MAQVDCKPVEYRIIQSEGSRYTDGVHPYDPGGPTRWGITLTDARLHWKPNATAEDVRLMPLRVALIIYKSKYWDALGCDLLPPGLDYTTVDYGVNSGIGRAGRVLRRLLGLPDNTWKITPDVLAAIAKRDPEAIIKAMNAERLAFLQHLAIWPTYKGGWTTRVAGVLATSLALFANPAMAATMPQLKETDTDPATPTTIPEVDGTAKGQHAPPTTVKTVIKTTVATGSGATTYGYWNWITDHPGATAIIVVCGIVLVVSILRVIHDSYEAKQNARMPGIGIVPVKGAT